MPQQSVLTTEQTTTNKEPGMSANSVIFDDFGSLSSGPTPLSQPVLTADQPTVKGWADFSQLGSTSATFNTAISTAVPAVTTTASESWGSRRATTTRSVMTTAFDDILPKEFAVGSDANKVAGSEDLNPTTEAKPDLMKKLTGFEILDEDHPSSSSSQSTPFPVLSTLVPEHVAAGSSTTSLDSFVELEGHSGSKALGVDLESNSGSTTSITGWAKVRMCKYVLYSLTWGQSLLENLERLL